jgi:hypothetical protein
MITSSEIVYLLEKRENSSVEFTIAPLRDESPTKEFVAIANSNGVKIPLGRSDDKNNTGQEKLNLLINYGMEFKESGDEFRATLRFL